MALHDVLLFNVFTLYNPRLFCKGKYSAYGKMHKTKGKMLLLITNFQTERSQTRKINERIPQIRLKFVSISTINCTQNYSTDIQEKALQREI